MAFNDFDTIFWDRINSLTKSIIHNETQNSFVSDPATSLNPGEDSEIIKSIESIFLTIAQSIGNGEAPMLFIPSSITSKRANVTGRLHLRVAMETNNRRRRSVRFDRCNSTLNFALTVYVLSKIYRLMQSNTICTKRDMYYQDVHLFKSQSVLDKIIDNISCLLQVPRNSLHVVATAKGCLAGAVSFYESNGTFVDCASASQGILIPANVQGIDNISSDCKFILIIEKDATFQKLASIQWPRKMQCIIVTGKGFPDLCTRLLVKRLWIHLHIPVLILVDADPYGIEIMCTYRFGSLSKHHESDRLVVPSVVKWIGLLPADIYSFFPNSPASVLPLSNEDRRRATSLLKRSYIQNVPEIAKQVEILLNGNHKAEIQALDELGDEFLANIYLPNKIRFGGWI